MQCRRRENTRQMLGGVATRTIAALILSHGEDRAAPLRLWSAPTHPACSPCAFWVPGCGGRRGSRGDGAPPLGCCGDRARRACARRARPGTSRLRTAGKTEHTAPGGQDRAHCACARRARGSPSAKPLSQRPGFVPPKAKPDPLPFYFENIFLFFSYSLTYNIVLVSGARPGA